jgi:hypothetical protein
MRTPAKYGNATSSPCHAALLQGNRHACTNVRQHSADWCRARYRESAQSFTDRSRAGRP